MIFDKDNSLWKSGFDTFWRPVSGWIHKIHLFHLNTVDRKTSLRITSFFMILDPTLYIKMCWHMGVVTDWFIWWILVVKAESFTKFEPMMKIFRVWIGRRKLQRFSKVKLTTCFHEFESTNFVFTKFSLFCFSTRYLEVFYCNQKVPI